MSRDAPVAPRDRPRLIGLRSAAYPRGGLVWLKMCSARSFPYTMPAYLSVGGQVTSTRRPIAGDGVTVMTCSARVLHLAGRAASLAMRYDAVMSAISDSAVVLKRLDYSETSQVIVFFTREHGKVRAIAKGIKRSTKTRFAVGIDLLDVGRLVVSSRQERSATLATLTEWKQTRSLSGLREKLFRIHAAQYLADITAQLTEDWDPHAAVFDTLVSAFEGLADADEPLAETVRYQLALLDGVGSIPRFDACVHCGRSEDLTYFSSFEGGMVCRHCEPTQVEKREVSAGTLHALRGADPSTSLSGSFDVLNYHIAHSMGREPALAAKLVPPARRRVIE